MKKLSSISATSSAERLSSDALTQREISMINEQAMKDLCRDMVQSTGEPDTSDPEVSAIPDFSLQDRYELTLRLLPAGKVEPGQSAFSLGATGIRCRVSEEQGRLCVIAECDDALHLGRAVRITLVGGRNEPAAALLTLASGPEGCAGRCDLGTVADLRKELGEEVHMNVLPPRTIPRWFFDVIAENPDSREAEETLEQICATLSGLPSRVWSAERDAHAAALQRLGPFDFVHVLEGAIRSAAAQAAVRACEEGHQPEDPYPLRWLVAMTRDHVKQEIERLACNAFIRDPSSAALQEKTCPAGSHTSGPNQSAFPSEDRS
jgi:hypothetical protein